jgi:hypothetical protein
MSLGRGLLAGTGWAGTLGMVAICVLMSLFAVIALSRAPRDDSHLRLPSVREGRVVLHPPGRGAPSSAPARPTPQVRSGAAAAR